MSNEMNKPIVLGNLLWKLMERTGTQGIQLVIQIVLARLLLPEDYGIIAIIAIFLTISGVFVQSGLSTALIQKKDVDETDFSTVFVLSLLIAGLIYITLFITATEISVFFNEPRLVSVLRVLSLTLFLGAFNSVQNAVIARNMKFKKLFASSIMAIVGSGTIGIGMAFAGFGVWALVGQQLANQLIITVVLWFTLSWRPKSDFSIDHLKVLFAFGWKLLVSALVDVLSFNLRSLIIGKIYEPAMLGYYDMGSKLPGLIISNINGSILAVLLPALSFYQDDRPKVKSMVRRAIVTSSFVIFPMMAGLAIVTKPIVLILLTEKWLPAVPFIQLFCIAYALWPFHSANLQAINALGRSDIFLKLELIKFVIGLVILALTMPYGIYAIAVGGTFSGLTSMYVNAYPNKILLNYSFWQQLKDISPSLLLTLAMGAIVCCIKLIGLPLVPMLILQILAGVASYVLLAKLFKLECYTYLFETLKDMMKKTAHSSNVF